MEEEEEEEEGFQRSAKLLCKASPVIVMLYQHWPPVQAVSELVHYQFGPCPVVQRGGSSPTIRIQLTRPGGPDAPRPGASFIKSGIYNTEVLPSSCPASCAQVLDLARHLPTALSN
ncbi:hypothetical protein NFI96_008879 [Prochilodus magdalenae]|nr:hypothetical protein NFI96_008879 [Prochilodus magdalenae]